MIVELVDQNFDVLTPTYVRNNFASNIEIFGRVCYKSEKEVTKESSELFVKNIIAKGHESVLEHCNLTIKFTTDRATANALVRHRHCAFSQESTHYINYFKKGSIQIIKQVGFPNDVLTREAVDLIEIYCNNEDIKPSVRRALLPLCLKTELVMTTNLREWRYILKLRSQSNCHPQMQYLMRKLLTWFQVYLPIFVTDIHGY